MKIEYDAREKSFIAHHPDRIEFISYERVAELASQASSLRERAERAEAALAHALSPTLKKKVTT